MKDFIKFALKACVALFVLGVGTKLGKDAINDLQQFKNNRNQIDNEDIR